MRGISALLDLMQHIARGRWRRAIYERGIAARSQDAKRLANKTFEVWKVMRSGPDHIDVECVVCKRKCGGVSDHPIDVFDVLVCGHSPRLIEHLSSEVETHDTTNQRSESECGVASARRNIQRKVSPERVHEVDHLLQSVG